MRFAEEEIKEEILSELAEQALPSMQEKEGTTKDNNNVIKGFYTKIQSQNTKPVDIFSSNEGFNNFFMLPIRNGQEVRKQQDYISHVMKCVQADNELSKKEAFILANCVSIATISYFDEEKKEDLEFLKSLFSPILEKIQSIQLPSASPKTATTRPWIPATFLSRLFFRR